MNGFLNKALLGLVLLFIATLVSSAEIDEQVLQSSNWNSVVTKNFSFITDMNEEKARETSMMFERYYALVLATLGLDGFNSERVNVVMIQSRSLWANLGFQNSKNIMIHDAGSGLPNYYFINPRGVFKKNSDRGSLKKIRVFMPLASHTIYSAESGRAFPAWYREAVKHYLSSYAEWKHLVSYGGIYAHKDKYLAALKVTGKFRRIDTRMLLSLEAKDFSYGPNAKSKERNVAHRNCIQSLLLLNYFFDKPARRKSLERYIEIVRDGAGQEEALRQVFGYGFDVLDEKLNFYANGETIHRKILKKNGLDEFLNYSTEMTYESLASDAAVDRIKKAYQEAF